jgi:hypothetical protein
VSDDLIVRFRSSIATGKSASNCGRDKCSKFSFGHVVVNVVDTLLDAVCSAGGEPVDDVLQAITAELLVWGRDVHRYIRVDDRAFDGSLDVLLQVDGRSAADQDVEISGSSNPWKAISCAPVSKEQCRTSVKQQRITADERSSAVHAGLKSRNT